MGLVSSGPPWARVSMEQSLEVRTLEPALLVSTPTFTYSALVPQSLGTLTGTVGWTPPTHGLWRRKN